MKERIAFFGFWLFILADLLTGLLSNIRSPFYRIGLPLKILFTVFTFILYLSRINKKTFLSLYSILLILTVFWIMGTGLSFYNNTGFSYSYSVTVLSRYFFFFILALVFLDLRESSLFEQNCKNILEGFFLVNNLLIFAGAIFEIDMLSTYDPLSVIARDEQRFGYKGFIYGGNDVASIYLIGVAYFFRQNFKYNDPKLLFLLTTCMATALTGTKAGMIGLILISGYYLLRYRTTIFICIGLPVTLIVSYLINDHWAVFKEKYLSVIIERYNSLNFITFLMTGRDQYITNNFEFMKSNWSMVNYITGDGYLFSETDLLDLYFFFGIGAMLYLYIYVRIWFIKDRSTDNVAVFIVLMLLAFAGGHFIQSATVPLFLLLYIFTATSREKPIVFSES